MEEFSQHLSIKVAPDNRFQPVAADTGIIMEKKLPGETDNELIHRTIEKCKHALTIAIQMAVKLQRDVVMSGLGAEELEVMAKQSTEKLIEMEQMENKTRADGTNESN